MTTITFDTHKIVRTLKDAGIPENQAKAFLKHSRKRVGRQSLPLSATLAMCAAIYGNQSNA